MAEEDAVVVISDSVVVSKKSSWTPIKGVLDSVVDVVWETESGSESESQPESISSCEAHGGALVLVRSTDSGPCEITVEFQQRLCHVRGLCILSSARTCEIYSQQELNGDAEYVCTARAELQEADDVEDLGDDVEHLVDNVEDLDDISETPRCCEQEVNHRNEVANEAVGENVAAGPFYEAEVELVNADAWAGIKIRLLSLQDKSRAEIKSIRVSAVLGPPAGSTCGDEGGNNSNSSLLAMLVPSVLQIVRGMSGDNRVVTGHTGQGSNLPTVMPGPSNQNELRGSEKSSEQLQASLQYTPAGEQQPSATGTSHQKTATPQQKEGEDFSNEMRFRLQRLEMICVRMESYLHMAFSKLDNRVCDLEEQIRAIHHEQSLAPDPSKDETVRDSINQSSTVLPVSSPPAGCPCCLLLEAEGPAPPIALASGCNLEAVVIDQEENVEPLSCPLHQSDSHEELNNSVPELVPATIVPRRASVSLDDAWTSALAAFSVSTLPEVVAIEKPADVDEPGPATDVAEASPGRDVAEACPATDGDEASPGRDVAEPCPATDGDEACPATDIDEAFIAAEEDEACGSSKMQDVISEPFTQSQEPLVNSCLRLSNFAHSQSSLQANMGSSSELVHERASLGCNLLEEDIPLRLHSDHNSEVGAESSTLHDDSAAGGDLIDYSDLVDHNLEVGAESSTLHDDSAAGGDLIDYSDLVDRSLEVGAESSTLLDDSAAGGDLIDYSDLVDYSLEVGAESSTLLDDSAAGGDYSNLVAGQSRVEEIAQVDGAYNSLSSQGSDTQCFSDSLLIDCVDGGFLMRQGVPESLGEKDSISVGDGFDLVFLPGFEGSANSSSQTEAALEACVSLLDVDTSDCVNNREAAEAADRIEKPDSICADLLSI